MKRQFETTQFANLELLKAIETSNFEAVKDLVINHGADVNTVTNGCIPLLALAIIRNNQEIIDFFLSQDVNINPKDQNVITTPLGAACIIAAQSDSITDMNLTFAKLLTLGAEINPANSFSSPLTEVIRANGPNSEILAEYLINKYNANMNPICDYAETPLSAATRIFLDTGKNELFFKCIELGAKVNPVNPTQISPLQIAITSKSIYATLITNGLIRLGANIDSVDIRGLTPFDYAIQSNNVEVTELLIKNNAKIDYNKKDAWNNTLIGSVISTGNLDMVKLLVKNGASLKIDIKDQSQFLANSISNNDEVMTNYLIDNGFTIDFKKARIWNIDFNTKWVKDILTKFDYHYIPIINSIEQTPKQNLLKVLKTALKVIYDKSIQTDPEIVGQMIKSKGGEELVKAIISEVGNQSDIIKYFNLLKIKHTFKNDKFILTTQTSGDESDRNNDINIKSNSKTTIFNHKIYSESTKELLDISLAPNLTTSGMHYVVDKKGNLFVNHKGYSLCHSYFLKGKEGHTKLDGEISLFGYGKPVACGGHMIIKDGIITKITNNSGHYMPNSDQLKIVCKHFYDLGILSKDVRIEVQGSTDTISPQEIMSLDSFDILNKYQTLEEYASLNIQTDDIVLSGDSL